MASALVPVHIVVWQMPLVVSQRPLWQSLFAAQPPQTAERTPELPLELLVVAVVAPEELALVATVVVAPELELALVPEEVEPEDVVPTLVWVPLLLLATVAEPELLGLPEVPELPVGEPLLEPAVVWELVLLAPVEEEEPLLPLHAASTARQQHANPIFDVMPTPRKGRAQMRRAFGAI